MEAIGEVLVTTRVFLITTFISLIIIFIAKWWKHNKKFFDLAAKLPKPDGLSYYPIIGHAHHYIKLEGIITVSKSFHTPCGAAYIGTLIIFFINDADLLEQLLLSDKCMDKPKYIEKFETFQQGLFSSNGERWRKHRKVINPVFNMRMLNSYVDIFRQHDERFVENLMDHVGETFDIGPYSQQYSFLKFFELALGLEPGVKSDEYFEALENSLRISMTRSFNFFYGYDFIYNLSKLRKIADESSKTICRISQEVIDQKLIQLAEDKKESANDEGPKNLIFLDYLLECADNGKVFSIADVIEEVSTFIVAGVDTCAHTFAFLCVCLGMHPDIQEKAYKEICDIIGPDRYVDHTDIPKFKYVEKVIKETMRMFPVGANVPRAAREDVQIGEHVYPKESTFTVNVIHVHYSEKHYKDPYVFNPDRFDPEEVQKRHKFAFIPFSAGKRNCIGERFAMISLIASVATILKKFRFETAYTKLSEIRLEQVPTLSAMDGFPIRVFKRD